MERSPLISSWVHASGARRWAGRKGPGFTLVPSLGDSPQHPELMVTTAGQHGLATPAIPGWVSPIAARFLFSSVNSSMPHTHLGSKSPFLRNVRSAFPAVGREDFRVSGIGKPEGALEKAKSKNVTFPRRAVTFYFPGTLGHQGWASSGADLQGHGREPEAGSLK